MVYGVSFEWIQAICNARIDGHFNYYKPNEISSKCSYLCNIPKEDCELGECNETVCPLLEKNKKEFKDMMNQI